MPRPIITAKAGELARKQLDVVLDWLEAAGGGGGSSAWGGITGTLSDQTDLQTALDAKASTSGLSETIDDRVAALLVPGSNITLTYNDGAGTLTIAASGGGGFDPVLAWAY